MIEVMVNGCNGKMGQIVCDLVDKNPNMILKCGADKVDTGYFTYQVYTNLDKIPEKPDVIIDFSIPVATFGVLEYAKKNNVPLKEVYDIIKREINSGGQCGKKEKD